MVTRLRGNRSYQEISPQMAQMAADQREKDQDLRPCLPLICGHLRHLWRDLPSSPSPRGLRSSDRKPWRRVPTSLRLNLDLRRLRIRLEGARDVGRGGVAGVQEDPVAEADRLPPGEG